MPHPFRKPLVALLACAALVCAQGWIAAASAAEWQTWPRQPAPAPGAPAPQPAPQPPTTAPTPPPSGATKAGEAAGKKTAGGIKAGTIGWAALIAAGIAGIAIAVGSGGGGSSSNH